MNFMADIISDKTAEWLVDNGYYGYEPEGGRHHFRPPYT